MANNSPNVVDISHHNDVRSFTDLYGAGIRGIIHKASEGAAIVDKTYTKRRPDAVAAGMLWGSYHYLDASTVKTQVSNYLRATDPDENTLLACDAERNNRPNWSPNLDQIEEFLTLVYEKTEQRAKLYGGELLKALLAGKTNAFLARHQLWLSQYGPKAVCPPGWSEPWLWQYAEKGRLNGIGDSNVDLNQYAGANLAAEWVYREGPVVVPIKPTVVTVATTKTDTPIVSKSPADRPEVNTPDPVPAKTGFTVNDLMPVSRKAFRLVWLKRAIHVTWISLTTDKIMDYMGIAKGYREQVESFVSDHSTVLVITGGLTVVAVLSAIGKLMASDASSGTYTPSGLTPETKQ